MHRIKAIDVHVGGEPLRVITEGFPPLPGRTILEKRRAAQEQFDHLRTALMREPRGHPDMYGCVLVPPSVDEAAVGVLFLHNEGYSTMCGHGIIGLVTVLLEQGLFPVTGPETTLKLETPSGVVTARGTVEGKRVTSVAFLNVPSFAAALDQETSVQGLGRVRYDVAFGGAFYAFCLAEELGLSLRPDSVERLIEVGMAIKEAVSKTCEVKHPIEPDLSFLYGTVFVGGPGAAGAACRHVCIFAEGQLDRCPTGTGVSAHLALKHVRRQLEPGQDFVVESILGTRFVGRIDKVVDCASQTGVIPEIRGTAYLTGKHEFFIDPADPLRSGFLLK